MASIRVRYNVVKLQAHTLQVCRSRMNMHQIIIIQRLIETYSHINNRINITAGFYFLVGISGVTHQGSPAEFKIPQVIGMINNFRTVGVGVQRPVLRAVPDKSRGNVTHVTRVIIEYFRFKRFWLHSYTPLKTTQQFVPPKPNALESAISYFCLRAILGTTSMSANSGSGI